MALPRGRLPGVVAGFVDTGKTLTGSITPPGALPVPEETLRMTETVHQGGCHCGKVRFEATTDLAHVISCNCSICTKHGLLLTFLPATKFTLLDGEEQLEEYRFNKAASGTPSAANAAWRRSAAASTRKASIWWP
jgi:hypothetical protein